MSRVDLIGKTYGNLTVVRKAGGSRDGSVLWECQCSCGNKAQVTSRHLNRSGKHVVRSCGCLLHRKKESSPSWSGYKGISGNWWSSHVKRSSSKRADLELSITKEYAWDLFEKQGRKCALTGLDIIISDDLTNTASVDRIDSSLGYIEGNIQWVHKDINYMKRNYSMEYFIEMCKLIAENNK